MPADYCRRERQEQEQEVPSPPAGGTRATKKEQPRKRSRPYPAEGVKVPEATRPRRPQPHTAQTGGGATTTTAAAAGVPARRRGPTVAAKAPAACAAPPRMVGGAAWQPARQPATATASAGGTGAAAAAAAADDENEEFLAQFPKELREEVRAQMLLRKQEAADASFAQQLQAAEEGGEALPAAGRTTRQQQQRRQRRRRQAAPAHRCSACSAQISAAGFGHVPGCVLAGTPLPSTHSKPKRFVAGPASATVAAGDLAWHPQDCEARNRAGTATTSRTKLSRDGRPAVAAAASASAAAAVAARKGSGRVERAPRGVTLHATPCPHRGRRVLVWLRDVRMYAPATVLGWSPNARHMRQRWAWMELEGGRARHIQAQLPPEGAGRFCQLSAGRFCQLSGAAGWLTPSGPAPAAGAEGEQGNRLVLWCGEVKNTPYTVNEKVEARWGEGCSQPGEANGCLALN
jgi:hypothetical protein